MKRRARAKPRPAMTAAERYRARRCGALEFAEIQLAPDAIELPRDVSDRIAAIDAVLRKYGL